MMHFPQTIMPRPSDETIRRLPGMSADALRALGLATIHVEPVKVLDMRQRYQRQNAPIFVTDIDAGPRPLVMIGTPIWAPPVDWVRTYTTRTRKSQITWPLDGPTLYDHEGRLLDRIQLFQVGQYIWGGFVRDEDKR